MMKQRRLLPLGIKNAMKTELPALVALEALGKPWFEEGHRTDLLALALVAQLLASPGSYIHIVSAEVIQMLEGAKLSTKLSTDLSAEVNVDTLRPNVVDILAWLQTQPNGRVQSAIERLLKNASTASA